MNKAQTAVPTIILTVMALIIWYVLWIYPEQRYELLFGSEQEIIDEVPASTDYYTTVVGEIGQSSGELLDSQIVSNLSVSYPATRSAVSSFSSLILSSSVIANEHKTVDLSLVDSDKVVVEIFSSTVAGNPKIVVSLNNTILYNNELLSESKTTVEIPKLSIDSYGNILRITCEFNGYQFWTTQQCGFDAINVYKYVFAPFDIIDDDIFYLTPTSENAKLIELSFSPAEVTEYPVNLLINGESVFSGALQSDETKLSIDSDNLNLGINNNISLIAQPGAVYTLSDISMSFYSIPSGMAAKYLIFDLPERVIRRDDTVDLEFQLTGIVEPGDLSFDIINTGAKYVITGSQLVLGTNKITLLTSDLEELGNNIKIYSTNGRLIIGELKIK